MYWQLFADSGKPNILSTVEAILSHPLLMKQTLLYPCNCSQSFQKGKLASILRTNKSWSQGINLDLLDSRTVVFSKGQYVRVVRRLQQLFMEQNLRARNDAKVTEHKGPETLPS